MDKHAILAAARDAGLPREFAAVPEFPQLEGGGFWLLGLSGVQRDAWERSLLVGRGRHRDINTDNVRARLVVRCLVAGEHDDTRIFTDADAAVVGTWRADVLCRLYDTAQRLSGVRDEDVDELKKFSETEAGSASSTS